MAGIFLHKGKHIAEGAADASLVDIPGDAEAEAVEDHFPALVMLGLRIHQHPVHIK